MSPASISQNTPVPENPTAENPETITLDAEKELVINQILEYLGEHCRKVLALYKLSLSNEEIARELNLSSPELAKKYAYRCREKFKAYVMERKNIMDFLNIHHTNND